MKNTFLILTLAFLYSCQSDLKEVNVYYKNSHILKESYQVDKKGLKQGPYKEFYKNGKLKARGNYFDSYLDKTTITFDEKGNTQKKIFASKGITSKAVFYYKNGIGKEVQFYDSKGYKTNQLEYWENGTLKRKSSYFPWKEESAAWISYDSNGKIDPVDSWFVSIDDLGDRVKFNLHGGFDSCDSITILQVRNYKSDPDAILLKTKFLDATKLVINKGEFIYNKKGISNIKINTYKFFEGTVFVRPFYLQIDRNKAFPKDNLGPIYSEID